MLTYEVVGQILAATLTSPPASLRAAGVTHWSSRRLADWLAQARGISVSHDSIIVLWRKSCLAPHRTGGFTFSTDPQLDAKVRDVAGLYLAPPDSPAWPGWRTPPGALRRGRGQDDDHWPGSAAPGVR